MQDYKLSDTLMVKRDKFSLNKCPKNDFEENEMQNIPYVSVVESPMYTWFVRKWILHMLLGFYVDI